MNAHPGSIKFQIPTETTRYKSYSQIILIVVNLSLSNLYFGYCLVYISTIDFNEVIEIFSISLESSTAKGILTGCIPVGAGIGALLGLKLIHVFSRRNFVLFINLIAIMAGSLIYITNFGVLICMRVIQGICVGLYTSIIPTYITEITPV
jgi:MFS family permease